MSAVIPPSRAGPRFEPRETISFLESIAVATPMLRVEPRIGYLRRAAA